MKLSSASSSKMKLSYESLSIFFFFTPYLSSAYFSIFHFFTSLFANMKLYSSSFSNMNLSSGFTKSIFTNTQFDTLCKKLSGFLYNVLTILVVFLGTTKEEALVKERKNQILIAIAGYLGLAYVSLTIIDAISRTRKARVRIFGEFALFFGFASVWALLFIIFENRSLVYAGCSLMFTVVAIVRAMLQEDDPVDARVQNVLNCLNQEGGQGLHLAALGGLLAVPDKPETETLFQAVLARSVDRSKIPASGGNSGLTGGRDETTASGSPRNPISQSANSPTNASDRSGGDPQTPANQHIVHIVPRTQNSSQHSSQRLQEIPEPPASTRTPNRTVSSQLMEELSDHTTSARTPSCTSSAVCDDTSGSIWANRAISPALRKRLQWS